jgi:tricorn protease
MKKILFLFMCSTLLQIAYSQQESKILRFPAVHGNQIVFSYAGDLYTVDRTGGTARRLTVSEGYELFARFSPDGNTIAFTGQYDGNTEVFTIPSTGGEPKRITYTATLGRDDMGDRMGPNNIVMTWTNDGKNIIYRSRRYSFNSFRGQLFSVPTEGGLSAEIPLMNGGFCSYSPDGKKLVFNRVFREFRTWKYYKGGMADDLWIYDFETGEVKNITNDPSQDIIPMWHGNEIYFLSNRDRVMNLFVYLNDTREIQKVTNFTDYDVKFPSLGDDAIAFEKGGELFLYEFASRAVKKVPVQISNEIPSARDGFKDASKSVNSWNISPGGERLVLGARGDIFSLPFKEGITRNLSQSSGVHEREGVWSPDGKYIAYFSDKTGEFEIYIQAQDGSALPVQLTRNADTYPYDLQWSPDSKRILWNDKKFRLQYVDILTKEVTLVEQTDAGEINDFSWAPDSRWITYSKPEMDNFNKIVLYNLGTKVKTEITDGWYESSSPVFSHNGKYLLFSSARTFEPIYSNTEWNHAYTNMNKIYLVVLSKTEKSPFTAKDDEVKPAKAEVKPDASASKTEKTPARAAEIKPVEINIDLEGIQARTVEIPVKASNYFGIACIRQKIYYIEQKDEDEKPTLCMYDLEKKEEKELGEGLVFKVSCDSTKMIIKKDNSFAVIDLPVAPIELKEMVDLSGMKVWVNYSEEWNQVFNESWRHMRDFFYDPNMHGTNWTALRDKYAVLLPYVKHRDDLTYLIGEMISELNVGHAYVLSGDKPKAERIKTGLLGAKLSRHSSGFYRIDHILEGANWSKDLRSPLKEVGVDIKEGDFIISLNGNSTDKMADIYNSLIGLADRKVELTVNSSPDNAGSRKSIVVPIADESSLYYYNWVQDNIHKVSEATNGQVGYIHIPDMGTEGLNEFIKHYYPQIMKKGLILDDRGNGGGNVSPMIIERLNREMLLISIARNQVRGTQNPGGAFVGPKVLLIDNYSASDGDLFAYRFKTLKMGKVIGVRTWGGVVGIRGSLPLIDGGQINKPEFASYSVDGKSWPIEGYGVDPDIVVDNDPAKEYMGEDAQLNKAIETLMEEMKTFNKYITPVPPYPDKTK